MVEQRAERGDGHDRAPGWGVLAVGILMIALLQGIALRSVVAEPWLGLFVGAAEVVLSRRLGATPQTEVLRWLLATFGVATMLLAAYWLAFTPT